ncbi:MAG: enoyl-CoA hydratase/isomerase family protein [Rhodobacteraceae bacterium]|uniref:enoyl-CoA hydratase/isomerase family protein n=1 Tax=Salipiger thiooxidans TaxID=282683 RepID=UPI001A8D6520|nr:enoyl-CoA hydratase/isomerase family protein [Salipiger thiooxidans]MBN8188083.1 enoyl-CoA hydratase/isomerase family protein [Salipiger thiooxidans]MBR9840078.1 enoyl-CoA hydratase/isomerase family protein [Paracoccaceae bacterium]
MSRFETLTLDVADFVATVTIDRAPVNAQNNRFREELTEVIDALGDRTDVRAIVLTGAGKAFSAGADLSERPTQDPGQYTAHNRRVRASFDCLLECPKPIIAAVNGAAIGAGCVSALCCDILVLSEKGFLQMTEVMVGLAGGVAHVRRHFGESDARMMIYTARRVYGPDLLRMNVASACVAPEELLATAQGIAADIARASPSAVRAAKTSFQMTEGVSIYEGYRFEQGQTKALSTSEDTAEAMAAFREKRAPVFRS